MCQKSWFNADRVLAAYASGTVSPALLSLMADSTAVSVGTSGFKAAGMRFGWGIRFETLSILERMVPVRFLRAWASSPDGTLVRSSQREAGHGQHQPWTYCSSKRKG
jgi:hypothetical protein